VSSDHLADLLDNVRIKTVLSGTLMTDSRWRVRTHVCEQLKILGLARGRAVLRTNDEEPVCMRAGDVVVLNGRKWMEIEGGAGDETPHEMPPPEGAVRRLSDDPGAKDFDVLIGGHVQFDATGRALLLEALPGVGHVAASSPHGWRLRGVLNLLVGESASQEAGSSFAVLRHSQLLLLETLRTFGRTAELPPGWLRALTDPQLEPALRLMHSDVAMRWTLGHLATAANMSRTSFAQRFKAAAGVPPGAYMRRWRMLLAARALREEDVTVGALGARLGYLSESSFSNAFKREVGRSPQRYRLSTTTSEPVVTLGENPLGPSHCSWRHP
jgi:AraC-like DNA-binding protein